MEGEEIRERMNKGLTISRIPTKTYNRFLELAKSDFSSDYGFLVKYLLDFHDGIITLPDEKVLELVSDLQNQIDELKSKLEKKPEENVRKNMLGEKIK